MFVTFDIINLTCVFKPVPIVATPEDGDVNSTILNPASGFALTCDGIVPTLLVTGEPPAFQHQATYVTPLELILESPEPIVNQFELKDVILLLFTLSWSVESVNNCLSVPLITLVRTFLLTEFLDFIQTRPGSKSSPVTTCELPFPL